MENNFESNLINIKPSTSNPIFSNIFWIPTLVPPTVPKQPQSIFKPLARLIAIATIKITSKPLRIAEFSFTDIPKIKRIPATNSIQGKTIARKFTRKSGKRLGYKLWMFWNC
jgi:hypothetical protein